MTKSHVCGIIQSCNTTFKFPIARREESMTSYADAYLALLQINFITHSTSNLDVTALLVNIKQSDVTR